MANREYWGALLEYARRTEFRLDYNIVKMVANEIVFTLKDTYFDTYGIKLYIKVSKSKNLIIVGVQIDNADFINYIKRNKNQVEQLFSNGLRWSASGFSFTEDSFCVSDLSDTRQYEWELGVLYSFERIVILCCNNYRMS